MLRGGFQVSSAASHRFQSIIVLTICAARQLLRSVACSSIVAILVWISAFGSEITQFSMGSVPPGSGIRGNVFTFMFFYQGYRRPSCCLSLVVSPSRFGVLFFVKHYFHWASDYQLKHCLWQRRLALVKLSKVEVFSILPRQRIKN